MIGKKLGNWVIDKELGRGGMGRVYLAHEGVANSPASSGSANGGPRQAAIKVLAPDLAQEAGFLKRFQREIDALSLLDHPNIVRFYDSGEDGGNYYYAMEYVAGQNFDELLKQKGRLPRERGSTKRPYEQSWQYAFEHFDLTKKLLTEVPLEIRTEPMESEGFREWIRNQHNLWIYCSNITEFHFFELEFADPSNVVLVQIIYPGQRQLLDLAPLGGGPVKVKFEIPLQAERIDK